MKVPLAAFLLPALLAGPVCKGEQLSKVTSSDFSGATAVFEGGQLVVNNMRVASSTTTLNDYVRGTFKFSNSSTNFDETDYEVFENVGVFNSAGYSAYFATNSTNTVTLKDKVGRTFAENEDYDVSSVNSPYTATLHIDQAISFNVYNLSADLHFTVKGPDGSTSFDDFFPQGSNLITGSIPILRTGTYTISFARVGTSAVTFSFSFGRANRQTLSTVGNGTYLQTDLRTNLRDYYKYRIILNAGDKLDVDAPDNSDSHLVLLNSRSAELSDNTGLGLAYVASASGTYYLFIDDSRAQGTNYGGYVHVTKASTSSSEDGPAEAAATRSFGSHSTPGKSIR